MPDITTLNNRYQIDQDLGAGGMAKVYRARDLMLERTVAVKVLREDFSKDKEFRERFRQEARAAANLSHPNIVTVHDFGLDGDSGRLFIVMEHVPGVDLKTMVKQRSRFTPEQMVDLMVQACGGLGYAHRAGLVHCDVKPQNMLVTPDNRLKVVDFGIARALASIHPDEKVNVVWGSPQYFSPEQAAGGAPSPASDVYSLGVIMYEMITGQLPFTAASAAELARMHREVRPVPPRNLRPEIPVALEQVLMKVLSKEPSARYRTADQLGRVLTSFYGTSRQVVPAVLEAHPGPAVTVPRPLAPPSQSQANTVYAPPATSATPVSPRGTGATYPAAQPGPIILPSELPEKEENPLDIDWGAWALGLLALISVAGLIPLWLWVYFLYNPVGQ